MLERGNIGGEGENVRSTDSRCVLCTWGGRNRRSSEDQWVGQFLCIEVGGLALTVPTSSAHWLFSGAHGLQWQEVGINEQVDHLPSTHTSQN